VDKVRKAGQWLWDNKERMVLAIMVAFLGYRVYIVLNPAEIQVSAPPRPPSATVPEAEQPPLPDTTVSRDRPEEVAALVRGNPFTLASGVVESGATKRQEDPGIRLLKIVPWRDGGYRAQVITKGNKLQYVGEGEQFENFQVMRIDPEDKLIEVFSNALDRTVTLRLP